MPNPANHSAEAWSELALTPPMGWNSWNTFRCYGLNENVVVETAEALVTSGMRDAGYEYVVVDDCWQDFRRDRSGRLNSNPERFPSGIPALAKEIHDRGLKFGLYLSPGKRTCAMIYDRYPGEQLGSLGYEDRDVQTFADWGVDYLKYDWCRANRGGTGLTEKAAFTRMRRKLETIGRPMVYSISEYGRSKPWEWAPGVANLWRTTPDIAPLWGSVMRIVAKQHGLARYARPGAWNDPDMLEVGNVGLSDIESRSHFMLWAMLAAPLMAGNDVRSMSDSTRQLLTHPGILNISQDAAGIQGEHVDRDGRLDFWRRRLSNGFAVGVLNRSRRQISIGDAERARLIGTHSGAIDVYTNETDNFDHVLQPHEMKLWRIFDIPNPVG